MMRKSINNINKVTFFVSLVIFSSCSKRTDFYFYLNNYTSKQLVIISNQGSSYVYTSIIEPYTEKVKITVAKDSNIKAKEFSDCTCSFASIQITVKDSSKICAKDPLDKNNWSYKIKKFKLSRIADDIECYFDINETDLQ